MNPNFEFNYFLVRLIAVLLLLLLLGLVYFPVGLPPTNPCPIPHPPQTLPPACHRTNPIILPNLSTSIIAWFQFIAWLFVITVIAIFLDYGIRQPKGVSRVAAAVLAALLLGGLLALFTLLDLVGWAFAPGVNLQWLGPNWYQVLITIFIVGALLLLPFNT